MNRTLASMLLAAAAFAAGAEERVAEIRQGTNLSVALAPGGTTLVVDLVGQLWSLPATGGGGVPLTPAGEHVRNRASARTASASFISGAAAINGTSGYSSLRPASSGR